MVEALLDRQWRVHVLLRGAVPPWLRVPGVVVHAGALEEEAAVFDGMPEGVDAVFHLAANSSMWRGHARALERDNVHACASVLRVARRRAARRVVMTSTLGVYADSERPIYEGSALRPATDPNPYLRTKLLADALLSRAKQDGLSVVSLHPSHLLGRYDKAGWISLFDRATDGMLGPAPRGYASFCSAQAVARAHLAAACAAQPARRYVLGGANASYAELFAGVNRRLGMTPDDATVHKLVIRSVAALAQWKSALDGKPPTITPGLARVLTSRMTADSTLAVRDLGYTMLPLDDILDDAYAYWARSEQRGLT